MRPHRARAAQWTVASMPFPNHLCLATATHSYKGDGSTTASIAAGRWVLVQGDRNDAPEGWCYALVEGQSAALLPISYLSAHEPGDFTAKALYDFTATEENELSLISGDYLLVEPSAADPSGWVTAVNKQSRERGFVPQAYIAPAARPPTSAKKPPPPSSPIKQPPSNRADGVDGGGGSSSSWLDEQQLGEAGRSEVEELAAAGARQVRRQRRQCSRQQRLRRRRRRRAAWRRRRNGRRQGRRRHHQPLRPPPLQQSLPPLVDAGASRPPPIPTILPPRRLLVMLLLLLLLLAMVRPHTWRVSTRCSRLAAYRLYSNRPKQRPKRRAIE